MAMETFRSLHDAKLQGYEPYDRAPTVYLVRKRLADGWKLGAVVLHHAPEPAVEDREKA